ncbi:MAG TPA: zf-HC2 domain-containing protein [Thermoanaerobaculia bacterium]|nr:zf-HC2 domain-containing protein [Thermoanaerobaculia bacterium]
MAVEQYLLGELNSDERKDFERHAFDCDACAAAIHDGIVLLDNGRAVVEGERRFRWGRVVIWVPSAVAAALAVVVGIQNFAPSARQASPAIRALDGYSLEPSRAAAKHVRAGEPAVLYINIPDQSQPQYVCDLRDASGHVRSSFPITKEQAKDIVPVALLRPLPAGSYDLVIYGIRDGNRGPEITNYPFEVGP